jgi:hypothetical protein
MAETTDKPGIEETYSGAVTSSNLRMEVREDSPNGAAGVLIAVGWSPSRLGAALMRLHTEYDGSSIPPGKPSATDVALLQISLKTLPAVHQQIAHQAAVWGMERPNEIATAVIAWWLAKSCRVCRGRQYQTIPGTPALSNRVCKACGGSGEATLHYGQAGRRLANYIEDCVSRAQQSIKKRLHK